MNSSLETLTDGLVAILLVLTICYCVMLNRRLKLLKADELSLRATISELVTATEIAERAISGLKLTVHECDMGLGERLRKAERVCIEVDRSIAAGKDLMGRLSQIVSAGRGNHAPLPIDEAQARDAKGAPGEATPGPDNAKAASGNAKSVAAAAEAFAQRVRMKVHGLAA